MLRREPKHCSDARRTTTPTSFLSTQLDGETGQGFERSSDLSPGGSGSISETTATAPRWQKWRPSEPTSPHWYEPQHLQRLIGAYLTHDQDTGRERTVREFISEFRGLTGTAKQKAALDVTGLARAPLARFDAGGTIDMALVGTLLSAMQANSRPVNPAKLGVIGPEHFRARFEAIGCDMESFRYKKVLKSTDNMPKVIETAFGWVPQIDANVGW